MKILTTILTHSGTQEQANACLDTWVNNIKAPHEYFFLRRPTAISKNG